MILSELARKKKAVLCIPSAVFLEIWAGSSMDNPEIVKKTKRILSIFKVYDLTRQVAENAGALIRNRQVGTSLDAIVAGTALYLGARLATLNKKHFVKIKILKFFKMPR